MQNEATNNSLGQPRPDTQPSDGAFQVEVWTSGSRGGGKLPADFGWRSNPKQSQEERGTPRAAGR